MKLYQSLFFAFTFCTCIHSVSANNNFASKHLEVDENVLLEANVNLCDIPCVVEINSEVGDKHINKQKNTNHEVKVSDNEMLDSSSYCSDKSFPTNYEEQTSTLYITLYYDAQNDKLLKLITDTNRFCENGMFKTNKDMFEFSDILYENLVSPLINDKNIKLREFINNRYNAESYRLKFNLVNTRYSHDAKHGVFFIVDDNLKMYRSNGALNPIVVSLH